MVILLTALGVLSFLTRDLRATTVIFGMVVLGVVPIEVRRQALAVMAGSPVPEVKPD